MRARGRPEGSTGGRGSSPRQDAEFAAGRLEPPDFGSHVDVNGLSPASVDEPEECGEETRGRVATVDPLDTIITTLDAGRLDRLDDPVPHCDGDELSVCPTRRDVLLGDGLALIDSVAALELARACFGPRPPGVGHGTPMSVRDA